MIIVGIDPSLTGTGIATTDGLQTIGSKPAGAAIDSRWLRLCTIADRVVRLAADADLVIIESPAFSRTTGHHHDRSGLWWLIIHRLFELGNVAIVEVTPTALKKFATGKGNATKPDMRMALFQRAGIDCRDDNQVDAWWLRQVGLHLTGFEHRLQLPKANMSALAKIDSSAVHEVDSGPADLDYDHYPELLHDARSER